MSCRHGGSTAPGSSTSDKWLYEQHAILKLCKKEDLESSSKDNSRFWHFKRTCEEFNDGGTLD